MDLSIQDWGAIGEMVGAIAIVISLFFVGLQIRDGNNAARATTTQAALDAEMVFQAALIRHADVWEKVVMGGDTSDGVETRQAIALYNMVMTLRDNQFQMRNEGLLEYSEEGLRQVVILPSYELWRTSTGAAGRSQAFLEHVDAIRQRETTR